jgi:hypothetical protein
MAEAGLVLGQDHHEVPGWRKHGSACVAVSSGSSESNVANALRRSSLA